MSASMSKPISAIWIVVWIMNVAVSPAEDWTQFRGPAGQGHSTARNLPSHWGPDQNIQWKSEIPGQGWSSPVVLGERIFLTAAIEISGGHPLDRSLRAICLDVKTGRIIWNHEVFHQTGAQIQRIHSKNSHASPTPITDGRSVFVHFGTVGTACLTLDGQVNWTTRDLAYRPQHGNGGSPVLVDGVLIFSCDGSDMQFVVALDAKSGQVRWKKSRPTIDRNRKFSFSTPLTIDVGGQTQIVAPGTNHVVSYDPRTGTEIWKVEYRGYSVVPRPVFGHGRIFISTGYDRPTLLAIKSDGQGDVTDTHVDWQTQRGAPLTPSMLVVGQELYLVSDRGVASCLDAQSGQVHWTKRLGGNYSASPLFADDKIYFQSEAGQTTVIRPGTTYQELARNEIPGRTLASFGVSGNALLLRTDTHLLKIQE
ncbi:MAG: PQQ-binding-like beta-propeller repeat protein [Planctomycetaceae bacterium]